jgi:hypothetical protein
MPDMDVLIAKLKMAMLRCARYFQDGCWQSDSLGDRSQLKIQLIFPDITRHKNGNYYLYSFRLLNVINLCWCIYR